MTGAERQSRWCRALEEHYARAVAGLRARGLSETEAHARAMAETREVGRVTLAELERLGLYPWAEGEEPEPSGPGPDTPGVGHA